ncbi:MAG: PAS domain-containing protein [Pseudomonadales bacterium]|nr:PAS domain-containing protein [Pseudomonadales bacterium]
MKRMLGSIVDSMTTAVVVLDRALIVEYLNAAAEGLLKTSASHAIGQSIQDLILLDNRILSALTIALENDQPFTEREATIRLPDNISEQVDFTVNILDDERSGARLLLELQHLNRLKRINKDDESVERQETTRRLIRGLAHEIKNPLGGIRGAAQLLEGELLEGQHPELKEYTGVIISETDRLKDLVDRMLGPQRQLDISEVNILEVLEHTIRLIQAERPGFITWRRDYDPSLPHVEGDRTQLIQAVMNVVRNACDALAEVEDPEIQLRSRAIRQFTIGNVRHRIVLQLEITDNGSGIDPVLQERIFFPMISGRAEGTGLGLAITQNVISQHRGSVQVTSRPGKTCFSIYIPFTYEPAPL